MTYKEGQTVFFAPNQSYLGKPRDVVISKVGRVWVQFENGNYRFDKETGRVDGYNTSAWKIYASTAEYHEAVKHSERLGSIRKRFEWHCRGSITSDQSRQIAEILGIKDEDEVSEQ